MCDQCQVLVIQGVPTHEIGCPNSALDPITMKPALADCAFCGGEFQPETPQMRCCNSVCQAAYGGFPISSSD